MTTNAKIVFINRSYSRGVADLAGALLERPFGLGTAAADFGEIFSDEVEELMVSRLVDMSTSVNGPHTAPEFSRYFHARSALPMAQPRGPKVELSSFRSADYRGAGAGSSPHMSRPCAL